MKKLYSIAIIFIFFIFLLTLFSCTCTTFVPPKDYHFDKVKTYNMSFDIVWGKIIKWFGTANTPIKTIDKSSGIISSEYNLNTGNADLCDCGTAGTFHIFDNQNGNFNIIVEKIDSNHTQVSINAHYNCNDNFHTVTKQDCKSTGKIETEIFDYISK